MALHRDPDEPGSHRRWVWTRDRVPASTVNRILVVAAVLVVVILFLWALTSGAMHVFGGSGKSPATTPSPSATRSAQPAGGSVATVQDGDLKFGVQAVRSSASNKRVVTLKVQNTTSSFVSFYGENQVLHGADKRTVAGAVALTTLEPHETAGVAVVFTIPAGFRATSIELHAAPGSHGVSITLA